MALHAGLCAFFGAFAFLLVILGIARTYAAADAQLPYSDKQWFIPCMLGCVSLGLSVYFGNMKF